jgi:hypothetical protein
MTTLFERDEIDINRLVFTREAAQSAMAFFLGADPDMQFALFRTMLASISVKEVEATMLAQLLMVLITEGVEASENYIRAEAALAGISSTE